MTPSQAGYSKDDAADMTTTDLLHILQTERLTAREIRVIKAELKNREI